MTVKITSLKVENVKRVKAVYITPNETGLTTLGGGNEEGKTSILDALCFGLGGEKFKPTNLQRDDSAALANIDITMSNGIRVERYGKNASLRVTDPSGNKGGQRLLDSFVEQFALNLPKFLAQNGKDKAKVLLEILGIDEQLTAINKEEQTIYDERLLAGRIADQKEKFAEEMAEHHDAPESMITPAELVQESQAIMARNAERQAARARIERTKDGVEEAAGRVKRYYEQVTRLTRELAQASKDHIEAVEEQDRAEKLLQQAESVSDDESTWAIEERMAEVELINAKVRANNDKANAIEDAAEHRAKYATLTEKLKYVRDRRLALLAGADMPLEGLSVDEKGELIYQGKAWDCMSSSSQMVAGIAIVKRLNPECGFVLLDGLERFDRKHEQRLADMLKREDLQAIATKVTDEDNCTILIEDGMVVKDSTETEDKEW